MVRYVRIRRLRDISTTLSMAAHEPVCNETPQSASAGRPQLLLLQRLRRGPRPARVQFRAHRETHNTAASTRKSLMLAGAATERSGGPADRPTPKAPPVVASRRPPPRVGGPADATQKPVERCTHAPRESDAPATTPLTRRAPPRSRRTRPSARSGRSRRRWPRTGPSPSGSACARATRSAGTRSGGTGAAPSSASSRVPKKRVRLSL